ncbi:MAG: hypothetical protein LBJ74_00225, partial [Heliobacteriaceae bacterium]|nr:hypothetical protein [Heliobacteriaceae bacterium]
MVKPVSVSNNERIKAGLELQKLDNQWADTYNPKSEEQTIGDVGKESFGWHSWAFAGLFATPTAWSAGRNFFSKEAYRLVKGVNAGKNLRVGGLFNNWQYSNLLNEVGKYKGLLKNNTQYSAAAKDAVKLFKPGAALPTGMQNI